MRMKMKKKKKRKRKAMRKTRKRTVKMRSWKDSTEETKTEIDRII